MKLCILNERSAIKRENQNISSENLKYKRKTFKPLNFLIKIPNCIKMASERMLKSL